MQPTRCSRTQCVRLRRGLSEAVSSCTTCDDVRRLTDWHGLGGTRNIAYFGDNSASSLDAGSAAAQTCLTNIMGVQLIDADVRDAIGNQTAPVVVANPAWAPDLTASFVAYGGCQQINRFDQIRPVGGASAGHYFTDTGGTALVDAPVGVASGVQLAASGYDITFPFSLSAITDVTGRSTGPGARTALLGQVLTLFGTSGGSVPVSAPERVQVRLTVQPNPFNPRTVVHFTGVIGRHGAVKVFNLRGELVRELQNGELSTTEFVWDGTDGSGASVASGVYVVRADADGTVKTAKVALVR